MPLSGPTSSAAHRMRALQPGPAATSRTSTPLLLLLPPLPLLLLLFTTHLLLGAACLLPLLLTLLLLKAGCLDLALPCFSPGPRGL